MGVGVRQAGEQITALPRIGDLVTAPRSRPVPTVSLMVFEPWSVGTGLAPVQISAVPLTARPSVHLSQLWWGRFHSSV